MICSFIGRKLWRSVALHRLPRAGRQDKGWPLTDVRYNVKVQRQIVVSSSAPGCRSFSVKRMPTGDHGNVATPHDGKDRSASQSRSEANHETHMDAKYIHDLFDEHGFLARRKAWSFFSGIVSEGKACTTHFNAILRFCRTGDEMEKVIFEDMVTAKVEPDIASFNTLAMQLRIEGDEDRAWSILDDVVARERKLLWNRETWKIALFSHRELMSSRAHHLKQQMRQNEIDGVERLGVYQKMFENNVVALNGDELAFRVSHGDNIADDPASFGSSNSKTSEGFISVNSLETTGFTTEDQPGGNSDMLGATNGLENVTERGMISNKKGSQQMVEVMIDPFEELVLPKFNGWKFRDGVTHFRGDSEAESAWVRACSKSHESRAELIDKLERASGVRAKIGSPTALSWRLLASCFEHERDAILVAQLKDLYSMKRKAIRGNSSKKNKQRNTLRKRMAADIGLSEAKFRKLLGGKWRPSREAASRIFQHLQNR